jgi:alkanesulfonate monooxygenase SsuD/methylene tetrahydromethanopterin reductase-like flavin-dependent oxidoreductase (luciferase family)
MKYATELITGERFGRVLLRRARDDEQSHIRKVRCNITTHVFDTVEEAREFAKKTQELLRRRKNPLTPEEGMKNRYEQTIEVGTGTGAE